MLSGIGDQKILNKHNIDIVHQNDQVGLNLQDHPLIPITRYLNKPISMDVLNHFPKNAIALLK